MTELTTTTQSGHAIAPAAVFDLAPRSLEQALDLCDRLAQSDMVPKDYQRKPGNILVAIQWGAEVGLKPLQAMQNIAVINGRPSLWGDALIALVRSSSVCEYVLEGEEGTTAVCRVKRRGEPEQVRTFSDDDAKAAGLKGKQGPWSQYPKRMRQMRARAFALRDVFPDVLKGLPVAEEVMDLPRVDEVPADATPRDLPRNATPAQIGAAAAATTPAAKPDPEAIAKLVGELENIAKNHGSEALREAWAMQTPADRKILGAKTLDGLKALAAECDSLAAAAAAQQAQEQAAEEAGDVSNG